MVDRRSGCRKLGTRQNAREGVALESLRAQGTVTHRKPCSEFTGWPASLFR